MSSEEDELDWLKKASRGARFDLVWASEMLKHYKPKDVLQMILL